MPTSLVWLRNDLRLDDNPALQAALHRGAVIPVFIWAPEEEGDWPPGAAARWWLHHSLAAFDAQLQTLGSRLILRTGPTLPTLLALLQASSADAVFWNRRYEPAVIERDVVIKKQLSEKGFTVQSFNASLLHEPWQIRTKQDRPYQVYTPYWRAVCAMPAPARPQDTPTRLDGPGKWPASQSLEALELLPRIDWAGEMRHHWTPGEQGANNRLRHFLRHGVDTYNTDRDRPAIDGTSALSPHLHFGEISPRRIWYAILEKFGVSQPTELPSGGEVFLKEIVWREFAYQLLFHFPHTPTQPLRDDYARFPWRSDAQALRAWQRGRTGYPFVDAGMRQLWAIGWMHNRVRMVVASFLVKHLLLPWVDGARWFWDTLVDADLASNTLGWQWSAGCGADAAPYFRIFNPVTQGEKFDPTGQYIRRWVPELRDLPTQFVHRPWEHPSPPKEYPPPLVEHVMARERALQALASLQSAN
ncbi:MAG: deoxyribodipyrimidine photo-lyase [Gemmataceae bacterium]